MNRQPDLIQHRVKFADDPKPTDWRDGDGVGMYPDEPGYLTVEVRNLYLEEPTQGGVKVKELEWYKAGHGTDRADTILGRYKVWRHTDGDGKFFWMNDRGNDGTEKTLQSAKAAAQADYDASIRSALSTKLQEPVGEPKRWLVERTLPSGSICWDCFEHELQARTSAGKAPNSTVTPLYTLAHQPVTAGWEKAIEALEPFANKAEAYNDIPGILRIHDDVELWQVSKNKGMEVDLTVGDLRQARTALAALKSEEAHICPICAVAFKPDDICATDIDMGICHAACLEGSPTVNLDTGELSEGPISTYRYDSLNDPK